MKAKYLIALALCGLAMIAQSTFAEEAKKPDTKKPDAKPAASAEFKLPAGWTAADMQACIAAGTPGKNHEYLAKGHGKWDGKSTMWMSPDAPAMTSDVTATVTSLMDGRFTKCEHSGEMPGMGPYHSFGLYGFDNLADKFTCIWLDNHGTGMMNGVGELSKDGKTLTWNFNYICPLTKKPAVMREIETITGENTKTLEMFGSDPKSGKEFKMLSIALTRK